MSALDIFNNYVLPYIPTIDAAITVIVTFIKNHQGLEKFTKIAKDKISAKIDELKQDKQIQEILDQNQIILQENAKLRKQMNELLTELTKVKHEEKQDN